MTATLPSSDKLHGTSFPHVELVSLSIAVRWQRPTLIPATIVANVLRGALGITFRRLVCPAEWMNHECRPCPLYADCAYGQVFMPSPPHDSPQLRLQQDLPRPFIIEPPGLDPNAPVTPERMTFRLTLVGAAIDRLPYFITTLERLGRDGMGRDRVPFDVEQITAHHPAGDETLFTAGSTTVRFPRRRISTLDLLSSRRLGGNVEDRQESRDKSQDPEGVITSSPEFSTLHPHPVQSPQSFDLTLRFLTPTLLKSGSGVDAKGRRIPAVEIRDRPPFGVIARRLRDRISALCAFFCEPWGHPDFASLGRAADAVELVDSRTVWLTRERRSTRTGQSHELSGFIGEATYRFPDAATLATFLPLLKLAEHVHVGKNAPWGNGKVRAGGGQ